MDDSPSTPEAATLPPDDPQRQLVIARPDEDQTLLHLGIVGDTYTVLLTGEDTAGRFTLIDMHVPHGGGPAPHRHDFEETFTVLDGEIELTFRGEHAVARTGETVNIPANAPHGFTNTSGVPARAVPGRQRDHTEPRRHAPRGRSPIWDTASLIASCAAGAWTSPKIPF